MLEPQIPKIIIGVARLAFQSPSYGEMITPTTLRIVMNTAKPRARRAVGADLVHVTRWTVWSWRTAAMATPDLSGLEIALIGTVSMRIMLGRCRVFRIGTWASP